MRLIERAGNKAILIEGGRYPQENGGDAGCRRDRRRGDDALSVSCRVATVGKVVTPARGKPMYLAATTGISDTDRVCGMVKNAVYGVIAAKADGIESPTVGIANVDGARQAERALLKIKRRRI